MSLARRRGQCASSRSWTGGADGWIYDESDGNRLRCHQARTEHALDLLVASAGEREEAKAEDRRKNTRASAARSYGVERAAKLRERHPALPILGVSGFVDPDEVDESFGRFMSKPITVNEFRTLVEEALTKSDTP